MIGFGEAISRFYRGYVKFDGRATRAEYWWPQLMQILVFLCMGIAFISLAVAAEGSSDESLGAGIVGLIFVWFLFALLNFLPNLAVAARRFHDLDQSGWLVLVFAVANALIGVTVFAQIIWFCLRGTDGPNQYGPDPFGYDADLFG